MKKLIALVLAAVMMMTVVSAFAAVVDTPKGTLTITGLQSSDTVTLYKIVGWDTTTTDGKTSSDWVVLDPYKTTYATVDNLLPMTAEIATDLAKKSTTAYTPSTSQNNGGTYTADAEVGMYLAIVTGGSDASIVYNPMILSVNWDGANAKTSELNITSESVIGSSSVAKKTEITLDKKVDTESASLSAYNANDKAKAIANGDTVPFVVDTVLPTYGDNYTDPTFVITDSLSEYLELNTDSIKVYVGGTEVDATSGETKTYTVEATKSGYTITFDEDYLYQNDEAGRIGDNAKVQVKYTATLNVPAAKLEELKNVERFNNTVEIEFTNNPNGDTTKKDKETNHYTFSLDADIDGEISGQDITSEFKKIGVDADGNVVEAWLTNDPTNWTSKSPLAGATFTLTGGDNKTYTATSGDDGHISFYGLDVGEYTLEETAAPEGYLRQQGTVPVKIEAFYKTGTDELDYYTVTVNGSNTSTYHVTNSASDTVTTASVEATNKTTPIVNTKGKELPTTGGIGTTLFYLFGGVIMVSAGIILVARRKAEE